MNDEDAFLATIQATPDDDTPRLVFADWLQERDDPRAEYLRLDVEITRFAREGRSVALAILARRLEMEVDLDPDWVKVVSRAVIPQPIEFGDWQEFYDSLSIRLPHGEPLPKPTVSQLDQFEAETEFPLPQSYREYILVFGPGKLLTDWDIAAPRSHDDSSFWGLYGMHESMRPEERWINLYSEEHREIVRRCRYFCSEYKDAYGWDPTEVCDPKAHEYAIYRIRTDFQVMRVADSFRGFVEAVTLDVLTTPGWDVVELGSPLEFDPATR